MKQPAAHAQITACHAKQETHRGRVSHIAVFSGKLATPVVPAESNGVKAHQNVGQVGPCVGPCAKYIIRSNSFCVNGAPQLGAFPPAGPEFSTSAGLRQCDQRQHQHRHGRPDKDVDSRMWDRDSVQIVSLASRCVCVHLGSFLCMLGRAIINKVR